MITEDYVSFETAKLLKEKGFVVPYDSFRGVYINGKFLRLNPGQGYLHNIGDEIINVCSLQLVMKWLREEHKIFLNINFIQEHFCFTYRIVHNGVEEKFVVYSSTYEEACEAAIKYCLENLI